MYIFARFLSLFIQTTLVAFKNKPVRKRNLDVETGRIRSSELPLFKEQWDWSGMCWGRNALNLLKSENKARILAWMVMELGGKRTRLLLS